MNNFIWNFDGLSSNKNITWDIIEENLNLPWNWTILSGKHYITWNIVKNNSSKPWDFNILSSNKNITWDIVKNNPSEPWNYDNLSSNLSITWDDIKNNPSKPWNYKILSKRKDLTFDVINNNLDKPWDYESDVIDSRIISRLILSNPLFKLPDMSCHNPLYFYSILNRNMYFNNMLDFHKYLNDFNWCFNEKHMRLDPYDTLLKIILNLNIPIKWITDFSFDNISLTSTLSDRYRDSSKIPEMKKKIKIEYMIYILERPDCDETTMNNLINHSYLHSGDYTKLSRHPNLTWNIIKNNLDKPWNFHELGEHPNIGVMWNNIKNNSLELYSLCKNPNFTNHPNLTWEIVKNNRGRRWDYNILSKHPNITWEIVKNNLGEPWNYNELTINPNITWDIIQNNTNIKWNYSRVCENPNITWSIIKNIPRVIPYTGKHDEEIIKLNNKINELETFNKTLLELYKQNLHLLELLANK